MDEREGEGEGAAGTIWLDVEDFFDYFVANPRPSGIQRLQFEIMTALREGEAAERIRFVRHAPGEPLGVREIGWDDVVAMLRRSLVVTRPSRQPEVGSERRVNAKRLISSLPDHMREPLFRAGLLHSAAGRNWRELRRVLQQRRTAAPPPPPPSRSGIEAPLRPGNVLLVLGAPWAVPGQGALLRTLKERSGVTAHLLLYDLIPVRHPEWCTRHAVSLFTTWLEESLPLFDRILAISRHTAADVEAYAAERGLRLPGPVRPIPIGTGFAAAPGEQSPAPAGLPAPGSYVLFVSTLEARKNHALAVRVWRSLVDEVRAGRRPPSSVPTLVFAGRVGWMVADLLQQLDNMRWLGGRIRLIHDPTDAELEALYRGCLFTLFPSFFEGWGLPVTESLSFGKPCLASSATALPEAGGALGRYFDPGDAGSALREIALLLDSPDELSAWQDRVAREFRPTLWAETARAVLEALATPVHKAVP